MPTKKTKSGLNLVAKLAVAEAIAARGARGWDTVLMGEDKTAGVIGSMSWQES